MDDPVAFQRHLDDLGLSEADRSGTRLEELALAWSCARGDVGAQRTFDSGYLSAVDRPLERLGLDAAAVDDLKQELRVSLLVGGVGRDPHLLTFAGRGPLRGWLRIIAVRTARKRFVGAPIAPDERDLADWKAIEGESTEMATLKEAYRAAVVRAFTQARRSLSERERTILALHLKGGLDHGAIARIYRVHRTTVLRWLSTIAEALRERTRAALAEDLAIDPSDCDSIVRLVMSRLDVSLQSSADCVESPIGS